MTELEGLIQTLTREVEAELISHPIGISEWELLQRLAREQNHPLYLADSNDSAALFRVHFLLFHCLYRLRDRLRQDGQGDLQISALRIQTLNYRPPDQQALCEPDVLRDYYLDLDHLQQTDAREIDEMLGRFWSRLHSSDQRDDALALLGLEDPVDDHTIRDAYRRLAMRHHPDRGGDTETLQSLHQALQVLAPVRRGRKR